jgi:dihydroflavonol-4-reductase
MKILITGASGFLGGNLARHFALQGHDVQVLVRNPDAPMPAFSGMSVEVFQGDLLDIDSLRTPMQDMDWVIHCGALVYIGQKNRDQIFNINVQGTENLCQVMLEAGVANMIHVSTVDTLGMKSFETPADEDTKQTDETPKSIWAFRPFA